jgi:hypothetical protein
LLVSGNNGATFPGGHLKNALSRIIDLAVGANTQSAQTPPNELIAVTSRSL